MPRHTINEVYSDVKVLNAKMDTVLERLEKMNGFIDEHIALKQAFEDHEESHRNIWIMMAALGSFIAGVVAFARQILGVK